MNQIRLFLIGILDIGFLLLGVGVYLAFNQNQPPVVETSAVDTSPIPVNTAQSTPVKKVKPTPLKISRNITIPADVMWYDTGIDIKSGSNITIRYVSGQWSNTNDSQSIWADGNGSGSWRGLVMPNAPFRSLLAKTGSNTYFVGNAFQGNMSNGRLYLGMNDVVNTYHDNTGELEVAITVK